MNNTRITADKAVIDGIVSEFFNVFRLEYKKLMKVDFSAVAPGMVQLHFLVVRVLAESADLPVSEIARKLLVTRPQMTHLTDQLIALEMVVRIPDTQDRRIIRIALTEKGKVALTKCRELMRDNVTKKLSYLENDELKDLSILLGKLRRILSRLE